MPAFGCNEQVKQTRLSNTENHDMVKASEVYNMKLLLVSIGVVLISLSVWALTDEEDKSYIITPEGDIKQQSGKFIDTELQEYKIDGLIMFKGICRWKKDTGADGQPVICPVKLFRIDKANKKLKPLATYFTEADGKFYLVTKDDDADYMIGPVTSKAENMPQKVKEFFKKYGTPEGDVSG